MTPPHSRHIRAATFPRLHPGVDAFPRSTDCVMETEKIDYRLERWIALILTLLFFLPFVAS